MIASVPARRASLLSASTAAGSTRASLGRITIGASVPSKSRPISAYSGSLSSAARPARPAGVRGRNSAGTSSAAGPASWSRPAGPAPVSAGFIGFRRTHRPTARALRPPGSQPVDQGGIERRGFGPVDQLVEQLVVPGSRDGEDLADLQFLGARAPPHAALERQDAHLALLQRRHATSCEPAPGKTMVGVDTIQNPPRA